MRILDTMGAKKPHHSTYEGNTILANTWIDFFEFDANNFGAALYTSSEGWGDGKLTMTSALLAAPSPTPARDRFVFQVNGANTFSVDWQTSSSEDAPWSLRDHLACTRTSAAIS